MITLERILFPTDFSDFSSYAASFAIAFACDYGAKLHVLHVVDAPPDMSELILTRIPIEELCSRTAELTLRELESATSQDALRQLDYEVSCVRGTPFVEIVKFARDNKIDMIVIGTHGRNAFESALLGSTAEKVVRKAPCPVFTVRKPGHRFVMPAVG
jgi:nucleotide-binding universal stress UspA family protein